MDRTVHETAPNDSRALNTNEGIRSFTQKKAHQPSAARRHAPAHRHGGTPRLRRPTGSRGGGHAAMPRSPVILAKLCFATTSTGTRSWKRKRRPCASALFPHQPRSRGARIDDIRSPRPICAYLARLAAHKSSPHPALVNDSTGWVLFLLDQTRRNWNHTKKEVEAWSRL